MFTANDAVSTAIQLTFTFETGFTNLQFLGMAADAMKVGDLDFGALISSHPDRRGPARAAGRADLKVLVETAGKADVAQNLLDKMFWRAWKLFSLLTGLSMDYYTPLEHRTHSFKEFMEEFINKQFIDQFRDFGLEKPVVLGPAAQRDELGAPRLPHRRLLLAPHGVVEPGRRRRARGARLAGGEVPRLERLVRQVLGRHGRQRARRSPRAHPAGDLPRWCATAARSRCARRPGYAAGYLDSPLPHQLDLDGRRYTFCSEPCQWVFEQTPEQFAGPPVDHRPPASAASSSRRRSRAPWPTWACRRRSAAWTAPTTPGPTRPPSPRRDAA